MPENQEQIGQFAPVHAAHAIEQVVFALKFDRPLEEARLKNVCKVAEQFTQELPNQTPIMEFSFVFGPGAPNPPNPTETTTNGSSLKKTGADGNVTDELLVGRDSLTFRTTQYSRWNTIWEQAKRYFTALAPLYAEQVALSTISVNYVDKFVWSGTMTACSPSLLLRAGSKYICPHVYDIKEFWHSHTGAFIRLDDKTRRLLNVNVDFLDEKVVNDSRRIVAITTVLNDQLNQVGYEGVILSPDGIVHYVNEHMQGMHVFGKEILSNIINEEMSRRIALIE